MQCLQAGSNVHNVNTGVRGLEECGRNSNQPATRVATSCNGGNLGLETVIPIVPVRKCL